ncbi:nuclease A inhibitor family protein [Microcoleus sp. MON1_C1]|uniref:nuclease A inhibitor family protein n=1 Tax=Microcoleus sp. MON1_C1 TaxID=2818827 RepID=UPI002FD74EDB
MTVTETLTQSSQGLLMPSESEYPFEVFIWKDVELTQEKILELTNYPPATSIEQVDLDYFFRNVATEKDWHDKIQKENVAKFKNLLQVIKDNLAEIRVYRIGTIEVSVYIVGKTNDGVAGLTTKVIET